VVEIDFFAGNHSIADDKIERRQHGKHPEIIEADGQADLPQKHADVDRVTGEAEGSIRDNRRRRPIGFNLCASLIYAITALRMDAEMDKFDLYWREAWFYVAVICSVAFTVQVNKLAPQERVIGSCLNLALNTVSTAPKTTELRGVLASWGCC
jgi:hypothetical protein